MSPPASSAEDAKIVTLARGARLRAYTPHPDRPDGVAEGASVRDTDGRTYAAATVQHDRPELSTSAIRAAVAAAASSGVRGFEAVAVVTTVPVSADDLAVVAQLGAGVPVLVAGPDGVVHTTLTA